MPWLSSAQHAEGCRDLNPSFALRLNLQFAVPILLHSPQLTQHSPKFLFPAPAGSSRQWILLQGMLSLCPELLHWLFLLSAGIWSSPAGICSTPGTHRQGVFTMQHPKSPCCHSQMGVCVLCSGFWRGNHGDDGNTQQESQPPAAGQARARLPRIPCIPCSGTGSKGRGRAFKAFPLLSLPKSVEVSKAGPALTQLLLLCCQLEGDTALRGSGL